MRSVHQRRQARSNSCRTRSGMWFSRRGVAINDDTSLEREADVMGAQATTGLGGGALSYPQHVDTAERASISLPSSKAQGPDHHPRRSTAGPSGQGRRQGRVRADRARSVRGRGRDPAGDRPEGIVRPAEQGRFDRRYEQGDCGPRGIGSMIGLDTNVLVRYFMQDDAKQSAKANQLIESLSADKSGFIPLLAIVPPR